GGPRVAGKAVNRLPLASQLETVILHDAREHERTPLPLRIVLQHGRAVCRVAPDQIEWNLRALDGRARHAEAVREIAQLARNRTPTAAHAGPRHARLVTARRALLDHEVERHDARKHIRKA